MMIDMSLLKWLHFHISWRSCLLAVTRRVSLVEQDLLTPPEHLSSPSFPVGFVLFNLVFCVVFCRPLFVFLCWHIVCPSNCLSLCWHIVCPSNCLSLCWHIVCPSNCLSLCWHIVCPSNCLSFYVDILSVLLIVCLFMLTYCLSF